MASRLHGWALTGWLAAAVAAISVATIGLVGWNEEGIRMVIRVTARTSLVFFALAFSASSLRRLWRTPASSWLLRNRRYVGVSFAASHYVHLAAIVAYARVYPTTFWENTEVSTIAGGGVGYVFLTAMALTSNDRAVAWLGAVNWKRLHKTGGYVLWGIFALSYVPRAFVDAFYVPFALTVGATLGLRIAAWLPHRGPSAQ